MTSQIREFVYQILGEYPTKIASIKVGLSSRKYSRVYFGNKNYIVSATERADKDDFNNFIKTQKLLKSHSVPVPEILGYDAKNFLMLQEDLGDTSLEEYSKKVKDQSSLKKIYERVLDVLIQMQKISSVPNPTKNYDKNNIMKEYNNLIKPLLIDGYLEPNKKIEHKLEKYYAKLASELGNHVKVFCHRDFQTSNIMLPKPQRPVVIDFQGARKALHFYDLVSLLECNYVEIPTELKEELKNYYFSKSDAVSESRDDFDKIYSLTLVQRKLHDAAIFAKLAKDQDKYKKYLLSCLRDIRKKIDY